MTTDSDTPATGTADTSVQAGADAIASLLFPNDQGGQPDAGHDDPETDNVDADIEASDDEDTPDEGAESDTDDQDDDPEPEPKYRLSDGTEVTRDQIEEWRKGNLRQADYTRKTQELAATRKELDAGLAEVAQKSESFQQRADLAIEVLKANLPSPPDIAMLQDDPVGYMQQKAAYDQRKGMLDQLVGAKQKHMAEAMAQQQKAFEQRVAAERDALFTAMPELRDEAKARALNAELAAGIKHYGFSDKDLADTYDHRLILMARDATAYRKLMANKPKADAKAKEAPPVQRPGRRAGPQDEKSRARKESIERLHKSGSLQDGANALKHVLGL